jgi:hypothetical protein
MHLANKTCWAVPRAPRAVRPAADMQPLHLRQMKEDTNMPMKIWLKHHDCISNSKALLVCGYWWLAHTRLYGHGDCHEISWVQFCRLLMETSSWRAILRSSPSCCYSNVSRKSALRWVSAVDRVLHGDDRWTLELTWPSCRTFECCARKASHKRHLACAVCVSWHLPSSKELTSTASIKTSSPFRKTARCGA